MRTEILYQLIDDILFNNPESAYAKINAAINLIDNVYFDGIQRDCETLPTELTPALRTKVVNDFKVKISSLLTDEYRDSIIEKLQNNNIVVMDNYGWVELIERLQSRGRSMQDCIINLSDDDAYVEQLYKEAKQRTFSERIKQSNKADVIRFHHALQDNTVRHVLQLRDIEMGIFLCAIASNLSPTK